MLPVPLEPDKLTLMLLLLPDAEVTSIVAVAETLVPEKEYSRFFVLHILPSEA